MFLDKVFAKKKVFPFCNAPKSMVFTCCHIIEENKPILYIKYDYEGCWQFLCGATHTTEDARIVSLDEMLQLDQDIRLVANLKNGQSAERKSKDDKWAITQNA